MTRRAVVTHKFVEYVPAKIEPGVVYISVEFATAAHLCCCGCGNEVVTPFSPTDWKLFFDGVSVSFEPSIGNWSFACKSHYWIRRNEVDWASSWSQNEIAAGRTRGGAEKSAFFERSQRNVVAAEDVAQVSKDHVAKSESVGTRILKWLRR